MEHLYPITEVCKDLKITSRTLRYYEEEGLLRSIRTSNHSIRHYTEAEISRMKALLLLRSYGFPIKDIKELYRKDIALPLAMKEQEVRVTERIKANNNKLHCIERAITLLKEDLDIFHFDSSEESSAETNSKIEQESIALRCTEAIGKLNLTVLYNHLSRSARSVFIPQANLLAVLQDTYKLYGSFIKILGTEANNDTIHISIELKELECPFPIEYTFHGRYIVSIKVGNLIFDARS